MDKEGFKALMLLVVVFVPLLSVVVSGSCYKKRDQVMKNPHRANSNYCFYLECTAKAANIGAIVVCFVVAFVVLCVEFGWI
jgi:hypothetical protein